MLTGHRLAVRRFRDGDLAAVVRIEKQSFAADAWPRDAFMGHETDPAALFFVASRGGKVCGYSLTRLAAGTAELYSVAVLRRYRGDGVARALLRKTTREAARAGVDVMWLTVRPDNAPALGLYRELGFRRARLVRNYYEDGSDGVRMKSVI